MSHCNLTSFFFSIFSATKASVVASAVFVLHKKTDLISAPASCVHLIIIIFFVYFKILGISDPLLPLENVLKKIFLGGIFDTLQETFYGKPEESEEAKKDGMYLAHQAIRNWESKFLQNWFVYLLLYFRQKKIWLVKNWKFLIRSFGIGLFQVRNLSFKL